MKEKVEERILEEIESGDFTRDEIALTYAVCISSGEEIDFWMVNKAIEAQWSRNALEYIKKKAWKIVDGKEINKMPGNVLWKIVRVYECPDCGELVRDIDAACNHVCKQKQEEKE